MGLSPPRRAGSACSAGWYTRPVSVALSATDDASGVAAIRYTLDGSAPTADSALYTGPFTVGQTTTVRYRAWDNAGNAEAANSQLVQIDAAAPNVAITAPSEGSTVKGVVRVEAEAGDVGSGVLGVSFYANGEWIGSKTGGGTVFTNWNTRKLKGQYTLTAVADDVTGTGDAAACGATGRRLGSRRCLSTAPAVAPAPPREGRHPRENAPWSPAGPAGATTS